jgi:hypothetical protein
MPSQLLATKLDFLKIAEQSLLPALSLGVKTNTARNPFWNRLTETAVQTVIHGANTKSHQWTSITFIGLLLKLKLILQQLYRLTS